MRSVWHQPKVKLSLLIALYVALAVSYNVVVPVGRGADEWAHYWYAQFIAEAGRLPASPAERETAGYKSDWPPLYHLAAAALTGWIDTEGPPTFKYRADSPRRHLVPALGPEAILHTEDEQWPWQQEILIWHLGRFLSIAFSTVTLLVTYRVAVEVWEAGEPGSRGAGEPGSRGAGELSLRKSPLPPRPSAPLLATAVLAFNPRFLFTSMLFNYDSLTLLLSSLFLLVAIRIAKGYHPHWGFAGLGLLAGLALVTKYLAAPLVLVVIVLAFWQARRDAGEQGGGGAGEPFDFAQDRQGSGGAGEQGNPTPTPRHALRTTHYVSRFTFHVSRFTLPFLLIIAPWFTYLIRTFNEIETYGPVLGTLAPLLRGDGSDRTVEALFAWLSGGQAPAPAHIEQQSYTAWQIIAELPLTFWGNPVTRPYPLAWFVIAMSLLTGLAALGLVRVWRTTGPEARRLLLLLLLTCALPLPFMAIRLFGARDALEAVQGRHILFLAGPAFATLLVWGWSVVISHWSLVADKSTFHVSRFTSFALRVYALPALLLTAAIAQLLFMHTAYPPLLPVRTTPLTVSLTPPMEPVRLPGGSTWLGYELSAETEQSLRVSLWWQAGPDFAPEDYQLELNLVDREGQVRAHWLGYQTQGRYPTRAWEPGDTIRDTAWLPLNGLPAGDYTVQWRLLGGQGPLRDWQTLGAWSSFAGYASLVEPVALWRDGQPLRQIPTFTERETAQFTIHNSQFTIHNLTGPAGQAYPPASSGPTWATFIIGPDWPPGDYRLDQADAVVLRVAANGRNFAVPDIWQPLAVDFAGKIKLLGYNLPTRRVQPGEGVPLTLFWQGREWLGQEFVIFTRLIDNHGIAYGGYDRLARENYSTLLWAPGEIITDGFAVPVAAETPPGVYTLSVGWYAQADPAATSLPLVDPETGQPTGQTAVTIGPIKVGGPPPGVTVAQAAPQTRLDLVLGEQIKLLGFDAVAPAGLTLYWQALAPPERDYTVFVHVRDAAGAVVAQRDRPPTAGLYPTSLWAPGETIQDSVTLPLDQLPPGRYELVIGLYDLATGLRLPVAGGEGDTILLKTFEVKTE